MEEIKFNEEFKKASNGSFPELKFHSAVYTPSEPPYYTKELAVTFLISSYEFEEFKANKIRDLQDVLNGMFKGIKVRINLKPVHADEIGVRNAILTYFIDKNNVFYEVLKRSKIDILIDAESINLVFYLEKLPYSMFMSCDLAENLKQHLFYSYMQDISVTAKEIENSAEVYFSEDNSNSVEIIAPPTLGRRHSIRVLNPVYSSYNSQINKLPKFIEDSKEESANLVLCGKVSEISEREYANKKYDASKKNGKQPEKLPIVTFNINDGSGSMKITVFPRPMKGKKIDELTTKELLSHPDKEDLYDENGNKLNEFQVAKTFLIKRLQECENVVCSGEIRKYGEEYSMTANAVFECEILQRTYNELNDDYVVIKPKKYVKLSQATLFDKETEIKPLLIGKTLVVFDLETTSLNTDIAEIIQISALKVVDGAPTETFDTYVKPVQPVPEAASKINNITDDMLKDKPTIEQVFCDFLLFIKDATLVGHNIVGYDCKIIDRIADKLNFKISYASIDTLDMARRYVSGVPNYKLTTLSEHFGVSHENAHRADSDVSANWEVFEAIVGQNDRQDYIKTYVEREIAKSKK